MIQFRGMYVDLLDVTAGTQVPRELRTQLVSNDGHTICGDTDAGVTS